MLAFVVERYGEYVLMKPTTSGANKVLWATGPALFLLALLVGGLYLRRRSSSAEPAAGLSVDEQARIDELLNN